MALKCMDLNKKKKLFCVKLAKHITFLCWGGEGGGSVGGGWNKNVLVEKKKLISQEKRGRLLGTKE